MKPYETVSSETVYKCHIFDVERRMVAMPDGRVAERNIVMRGDASAIIPVRDDGKIIFVRQFRTATNGMMLEVPAGVLDGDEAPEVCAKRELEEETGMKSDNISFVVKFYTSIGFCTEVLHIYLAEGLYEGQQDFDEDEFITLEAYTLDEAIGKIFSGEIIDSKTMVAIMCYKELLAKRNAGA